MQGWQKSQFSSEQPGPQSQSMQPPPQSNVSRLPGQANLVEIVPVHTQHSDESHWQSSVQTSWSPQIPA